MILHKLPNEVIIEITKHLSVVDIVNLMICNKSHHHILTANAGDIINFQYMYYKNKKSTRKCTIEEIEEHLSRICYMVGDNFRSHCRLLDLNTIPDDPIEFIKENMFHMKLLFSNTHADSLFKDILRHFINTGSLRDYGNKYSLFACNIFFELVTNPSRPQINMYQSPNYNQNRSSVNHYSSYAIDFLDCISHFKFSDIKTAYFCFLLHSKVILSFHQIWKMSQYVSTFCKLKKIFGYRCLDLRNTTVILCCDKCKNDATAIDLVSMRYNIQGCDLLSHNYNEIKSLLFNKCRTLYDKIVNLETNIIDKNIVFMNPISNRNVRFKSRAFIKMITVLKSRNNFELIRAIDKIIVKQRYNLLKCSFF